MKIVHIVESFAGGVFDFLVDLSNGMSNHEHIIIYAEREHTPKNFKDLFPNNTQFILWSNATREIDPKKDFLASIVLVKHLKLFKDANAIHLHSSKAGFLGRIAARWLGVQDKVIYTPHGVSFLREDVSPIKHKLFVNLEKVGAWFGGKVVACSKSEAEAFHLYNIEAKYVNNGIKCKTLQKGTRSITANKKIRIGTIGRITYQKNPAMFNEIAHRFKNNNTIEFIWIGGGGELESELTSPNIVKTGWLSREGVNTELSQIDIYLSTSLWEGLPLSVLQAMCFENPLLLSNCVGNRDLVKDNYNGTLFNTPEEAKQTLADMLENPESLEVYGKNSKQLLLDYFTITQTVSNYAALYQEVSHTEK